LIHYHGSPLGGKRQDVIRFFTARHALIPFPNPEDLPAVAAVCQSFIFDNGAFGAWKRGEPMDVPAYLEWVAKWCRHPGFDWALIPDVIDGTEADNDRLIADWPKDMEGVPVYHYHESLERLESLAATFRLVALGSSGQWPTPGTESWWERTGAAMRAICDRDGRPRCKLHGLRMLSPTIFRLLPLHSADSTNAAQNSGLAGRFGMYTPPTSSQRAAVIAERIEHAPCAAVWSEMDEPATLFGEQP
jgi:hypothetical protein